MAFRITEKSLSLGAAVFKGKKKITALSMYFSLWLEHSKRSVLRGGFHYSIHILKEGVMDGCFPLLCQELELICKVTIS